MKHNSWWVFFELHNTCRLPIQPWDTRKTSSSYPAYWLLYLPRVTPKAWLSRLRIENCDLTPTHACVPISHAWWKILNLYSFNRLILKKIIKYLNKLELMRENNDRTFAKFRVLVGKATGDIWSYSLKWSKHRFTGHQAINRNVFGTSLEIFGRLRKSSDNFGYYRSPTKNLDTLRITMSRLWIAKSWQVYYS